MTVAPPTKVTFPGANGDELAGRLDLPPNGPPRAIVLFAHCFTCGKDIAAASRISAGLVAEGFGVFRFDFTGLGSSQGEFANTNFTSNVADLVAAAEMLADRYEAPRVLIGAQPGRRRCPGRRTPAPRGGRGGQHRRTVRSGARVRPVEPRCVGRDRPDR